MFKFVGLLFTSEPHLKNNQFTNTIIITNIGAKVDIKIGTVKLKGKDPNLLNPSPTSIRNAHKIEITVPY